MPLIKSDAALIIIDMQKGISLPGLGRRNNPHTELNVQRLLETWRHVQRPVVHVRHISRSPASVFWPGQPGCEFQEGLAPRGIEQLVIVGVITNNSVESTVRSAGCLGFDVIVGSDAYQIDLNGRLWPAEDVHALSLASMAMDYARVRDVNQILEQQG